MRRAHVIQRGGLDFWVAAERLPTLETEDGHFATVRGWMESIGPTTIAALAGQLALPQSIAESTMAKLEAGGQVLRGRFTAESKAVDA